jgi:murein DD-endopeptidase MepM/ murein hydrolase activator NlpD
MRYPTDDKTITSPFGERVLNGEKQFHPGIDLRCPKDAPVYAPEKIKILRTGKGPTFGEHFTVAEGLDTGAVFKFMHCMHATDIMPEAIIDEGEVIATSDCSGTTAYHLHFEVWPKGSQGYTGKPIDPEIYLMGTYKPFEV